MSFRNFREGNNCFCFYGPSLIIGDKQPQPHILDNCSLKRARCPLLQRHLSSSHLPQSVQKMLCLPTWHTERSLISSATGQAENESKHCNKLDSISSNLHSDSLLKYSCPSYLRKANVFWYLLTSTPAKDGKMWYKQKAEAGVTVFTEPQTTSAI